MCENGVGSEEQEWAEVVFVPSWVAHKKDNFLVTGEHLGQQPLPGVASEQMRFPFPTMEMGLKGLYKIHAG